MTPISPPRPAIANLSEERAILRRLRTVSWAPLMAGLILSVIGLATVHSASAEMAVDYLPRQLVWVLLGLPVLVLGMVIDYHFLLRYSIPVYAFSLLLLVLVLIFGHEAGGARSWVGVAGLGLQPSEFAKLATVFMLARYLAAIKQPFLDLKQVGVALALVGVPILLIVEEPDLGGAVILTAVVATMVFVAGVRLRTIFPVALLFLAVGTVVWSFGMRDYQRERIASYLSPESDPLGAGYQVRQSRIAVGSGEVLGRGFMQGTQSQLRFLPARHTDFVFAVLAEERGFLGVITVLALYMVYLFNGLRVAGRARDRAGVLLVVGLVAIFAFHVLYNTAMVVGLLPVTGIPVPFLSYGGSFTLFCFFATGLILGIDFRRYVNR